ncbi:BatA and WFA domain-containing protein [Candidatus Woesearchaeota archaeon]|nr:MAG: hypothetical protein QS99_C0013G0011 [archaeon GW2011_AR4]MBS3130688.1 BatA and WFA domain-containing protein [Candidatus Woesearchaeota archaeon]HIH38849.1 hypothetical protein [Candidatus Woesearchaeota archaeon]HIH48918.1 hypothetical protein [Candidatus Woesearchaeota archaeon]HIJ04328.1 hypothetical protein [Candidatus Woesearchaeota archaeon]
MLLSSLSLFYLGLIPVGGLILLYLMRPRPREVKIPSLMFFFEQKGQMEKSHFFRNIFKDLLFFLQVLILLLLAFSLAEPFLNVPQDVLSKHTVLILDVSASQQVGSRFPFMISEARKYIDGRTTIILAGSVAETVLEKGTRSEAEETLANIEPKDTTTNLEPAMRETERILKDRGRIVVISDFLTTGGQDPYILKRLISAKGIPVEFISTLSSANNIGFIDMLVERFQTRVFVKNFMASDQRVTIKHFQDNEFHEEYSKTIAPEAVESFTFETLPGRSTIELGPNDDFSLDNKVYVSGPQKNKIKVLLISNEPNSHLQSALEASPEVQLEVAEPPILPAFHYDIIILDNVDEEYLLPNLFYDLKQSISNSTHLIINAHDTSFLINHQGLLPVDMKARINTSSEIIVQEGVPSFVEPLVTSNTILREYYGVVPKDNDTRVLVREKAGQNPILAERTFNGGKIVYYGIMPEHADFKLAPEYPIFWNQLVNYLVDLDDPSTNNLKIEGRPLIDNTGFYEERGRTYAVNLLNEKESAVIGTRETTSGREAGESSKEAEQKLVKVDYTNYFLLAAILFMFFELWLIKRRGDL